MSTQTPPALLLPLGQYFGTFYPKVGAAERYQRVRLGPDVWDLDDHRFALWALAHSTADRQEEQVWSLASVRQAAAGHLPGVDVEPLLDGLIAEGLIAEVTPDTQAAVDFAQRHRLGSRMVGLGNSAEEPWLWSIGFFERPIVKVTRSVYNLWESGRSGESLWDVCESLGADERESGGSDAESTEPELLLPALLRALHPLLLASVVYLEPQP
ncbi:hypothetical protein [Micromonospora craniellae]|uniref:hypothetical protein n=1 Tax=Micromonospora craniellae TaxID=2294034 RepID=UPI001CC81763|nr:hypothetical protein [Micromonospora craniellae]